MIILHMFLLIFNVKRSLIFLYHRPKMLRNITCGKVFNCLFWLHVSASRFVLRIKNPCDFGCLYRVVLRTDFNPDYLIFSRFYLKNRITAKPTPKSLFFNDSNARRGIATLNSNSMVSDGNSTYSISRKGTNGRAISPRPIQREIKRYQTPNSRI